MSPTEVPVDKVETARVTMRKVNVEESAPVDKVESSRVVMTKTVTATIEV